MHRELQLTTVTCSAGVNSLSSPGPALRCAGAGPMAEFRITVVGLHAVHGVVALQPQAAAHELPYEHLPPGCSRTSAVTPYAVHCTALVCKPAGQPEQCTMHAW